MSLLSFLRVKRCKYCLREIASLARQWEQINKMDSEIETLEKLRVSLIEQGRALDVERNVIQDRERILVQRESLIEDGKSFMAEKEVLLSKREATLWAEKERMLGQDGSGLKRDVLLPSLQKKWEAEKMKIDAERVEILQSTPRVFESLESKKIELEKIIAGIKGKPASSSNQILLAESEGRMKQLIDILALIDSNKGGLYAV